MFTSLHKLTVFSFLVLLFAGLIVSGLVFTGPSPDKKPVSYAPGKQIVTRHLETTAESFRGSQQTVQKEPRTAKQTSALSHDEIQETDHSSRSSSIAAAVETTGEPDPENSKNAENESAAAAAHQPVKLEVVAVYNNEQGLNKLLQDGREPIHQFKSLQAVTVALTQKEIDRFSIDPDIDYIDVNTSVELVSTPFETIDQTKLHASSTGGTVPPEESEWSLQAVKTPAAWDEGFDGSGIKVAVIDSGIAQHPDLSIAGGVSTVSYTAKWTDDHGHGTHVAGIIGARRNNTGIAGVAPGVKLYAVKALDKQGEGNLLDILEGIDWSIANKMDIINLSLGTDTDARVFRDLVDKANQQGIILVSASGNTGDASGTGNTVTYPAAYNSVIAVSAVDRSFNRGSFSSTGAEVEFTAPGVNVVSTYLNSRYASTSGTSQAAPHISGIMAVLKQKYPGKSSQQLRSELTGYAKDLGAPGRDTWYGYGMAQYKNMDQQPSDEELLDTIERAVNSLALADETRKLWDYDTARHVISLLPEAEEKAGLTLQLNNLQNALGLVEFQSLLNVDRNKSFLITFTRDIDAATISDRNVFIRRNGSFVNGLSASLNPDGESITVKAPPQGYVSGGTYFLYVDKTIKAPNGRNLKFPVIVRFTVK
ncbi:S8 family serine peptidase [Bacillus marinisedimentorum]|uniref:S8 family serine peptidase n=1 Tax=Bacillus marinisedimentorum TaxID=1821260 RepID=UPI000873008F|nr:S8 family serine peptidase [Bacillus marinisedimentorum]